MTKRKTKTTKAVATRAQAALVPFDDAPALPDFPQEAREKQRVSVAGGGVPTIKTSSGAFLFPGDTQGLETFEAVALVALRRNSWWDGRFDPNNPAPPDCTAIARLGQHENEMVPDPACVKVQAESCRVCVQNVGPNKPCRNGLNVALIHADQVRAGAEAVAKATLALLRISSTGIAPFGKAIRFLDEKGLPLHAALIRFVQQHTPTAAGGYYTILPELLGAINSRDVTRALGARVEEAEKLLLEGAKPLPIVAEQPTVTPAPRKRARR